MKTKYLTIVSAFILVLFLAASSFGQAPMKSVIEGGKKPVKIELAKVPTGVTESFYREYPVPTYQWWYGHPGFANDYEWYGYDPYFYESEYPEYYIVEFEKDKVAQKAVYSKAGKKIAVHKKIKTSLPTDVTAALAKTEYKLWKVAVEKEEIFKDGDNDVLKVYKIIVEKGKKIHTLYYRADGTLLKDVPHKG